MFILILLKIFYDYKLWLIHILDLNYFTVFQKFFDDIYKYFFVFLVNSAWQIRLKLNIFYVINNGFIKLFHILDISTLYNPQQIFTCLLPISNSLIDIFWGKI